ncbi:MAG: helix-turn-helix domain-containing protein [Polyangiaceae bacterium]
MHTRAFRRLAGDSPVKEIVRRLARFFEQMSLDDLLTLLEKLDTAAARKLPAEPAPEPMDLASVERRAIEAALKATKGNRLRAAALLGINRTTLYNKLRHYARRRPR